MLRVDWNLLLTIINLLLLFVLMRIFLFKPVQKIIAARQEEADRQFKEAGESKQAAEEARKQYEASLANAEEAKKQVLQEARQTADAEYKRIVSDAEKTAKHVKEDAITDAENQKAQILKKAEKDIADMVVDATVKIVGEKKGADPGHSDHKDNHLHIFPGNSGKTSHRPVVQVHDVRILRKGHDKVRHR